MEKFDVCVIGGGPSGFAAAIRALDFGKKVALVEMNKIGGAGIFNGALSSKTLWELSCKYQNIKDNNSGFRVFDSEINYSSVINEMHKATHDRYAQLKEQIDYYIRSKRLSFYHGKGSLASRNEIEIALNNGVNTQIYAENIVLAIGSKPREIDSIPIDHKTIVTSDSICDFEAFPKSMVVLGAGVIGCEFATVLSNFGQTKVYVIDKTHQILPFEDEDISSMVAYNLEQNGVHIHRNASLQKMEIIEGRVQYNLLFDDGHQETHTVEKALVSIGREANYKGLGLEKVGVEINSRGNCIDNDTQTTVPNIYAVGDFTADIALVNIAELEGRHAIEKMYASENLKKLCYNNISTIMFLNPEVAGVGYNEKQCMQQKIPFRVAKMKYKFIGRAVAMRRVHGIVKLIVTDDNEMKVLGLRVLGEHASSTIEAIALLIHLNLGVSELVELVHPHPSITEGIQECARMLYGKSILKPQVFTKDMYCYSVSATGEVRHLNNYTLSEDGMRV